MALLHDAFEHLDQHATRPAIGVYAEKVSSLATPALALVAVALSAHLAWSVVIRPIDVAADAIANTVEVVTPAEPETPQARADRAEAAYQAAQRRVFRDPTSADLRAEAAERLTDFKAAQAAFGR